MAISELGTPQTRGNRTCFELYIHIIVKTSSHLSWIPWVSCTLFNVGGKTYKQVVVSHYSFEEETQHWLYRTMEHCAMKQKG